MNISGLMQRKVVGVPVLYLAAGAVTILAVVAWKMKPANSGSTASEETPEVNPYDSLETNGTVIAPTTTVVKPERPGTNAEWIREGAEWLSTNKSVNPTAAYAALSKYINGQSRSTTEAQWVDWVITEKGFPPDDFVDSPLPPATGGGATSGAASTRPGLLPWPSTPPVIPDNSAVAIRPRPTLPYVR